MFRKEDLEKCHFVPMKTIKKMIEIVETRSLYPSAICKQNLLKLQNSRKNPNSGLLRFKKWKQMYEIACCKAIYAHNWNKLLYLLKKCPPWEHQWIERRESALYVRALTILLMYHPSSQAQGLLNNYLHMVWSCRSDEDKKAILKILLTLPEKIQCTPIRSEANTLS